MNILSIFQSIGAFFGTNYSLLIIVLILFTLLIVSITGNINIDWDKKKFIFGSTDKNNNANANNDARKRSCSDCIMLILGKRTLFESKHQTLQSRILRDQMTYVEHKIQEIKYFLLETYQQDIEFFRNGEIDSVRENKEYIIYQESLSNALFYAKDEIRRSFKENGFHTLDDSEFKTYMKDREQTLITIVRDYIKRTYPATGMIVPLPDRFKRMDGRNMFQIEEIIYDSYLKAKQIRNKIQEELNILQDNFVTDINLLVEEKNA